MPVDRNSSGTLKMDSKIVVDSRAQYALALHVATSAPVEEVRGFLDQLGLTEPVKIMRRNKRLRGIAPGKEQAAPEIPSPRSIPVPRVLSQMSLKGRRL